MTILFSPRRVAVTAFVSALAFAAGTPSWGAESLSLEDALRIAAARSRQLVAQDALASAAREQSVAAGQLPDPVLKFGINNLPVNGADRFNLTRDFMTMRSVGVVQEITRADKRAARSARFEREAEVAAAGRVAALANLRRDTALAWLERHYQERVRDLLRIQRAEAGLQVEAADAAYRGTRGTQGDVFAARSAVALIDDRIRQAERQVATASTRLARWVGENAQLVLAEAPSLALAPFDASALENRVAQLPLLAVMARQEALAQADVEVALGDKKPDWSVELMYNQRGPAFSNMVSLNFSVPLQFDQKNRQDREVAARLALVGQLRAQREEAVREQMAVVRAWQQEWQGNRDRLAAYDRELVPLATERTRAALASYRGGSGPLFAVLEARRFEIDTRIDRLRLEMETAALWAQLNYLFPSASDAAPQDRPAAAVEK